MNINTTNTVSNHPKFILNQLKAEDKLPFSKLLFSDYIDKHTSDLNYRERVFTPKITIWSFLSQSINADPSCQAAVARVIAYLANEGKKLPSTNTAAFSKARSRLPEIVLSTIAKESAKDLENAIPTKWLWRNRHIKLIDGTTISMPDTAENQKIYPQSPNQKTGIGFPIARLVAVISYVTGTIFDLAIGPYAGKKTGESALLRQLMHTFKPGDIAIADCYYASYFQVALLIKAGVDIVFPIHQSRLSELRNAERLGKKDHITTWKKPRRRPEWMDDQSYNAMPKEIKIREVLIQKHRPGFQTESRILVTTFLDAKAVSRDDLAELFGWRWHVELDLRAIKDVMNMSILRGKSPEMVRKEIWAHVIAYNLIRKIIVEAANNDGTKPRLLSFKLTLQLICSFQQEFFPEDGEIYNLILKAVARRKLNSKERKPEPRRVKRRPKTYPLLMKKRATYHQERMHLCLS